MPQHEHIKKTKVTMSSSNQNFKIAVQGKDFLKVEHYLYLGKKIPFNNDTCAEIRRRIQLGWVKFGCTFQDHTLPVSLKRQKFDQCIILSCHKVPRHGLPPNVLKKKLRVPETAMEE